jgi:hypothetical protein
MSSGIWCHLLQQQFTSVLEEPTSSVQNNSNNGRNRSLQNVDFYPKKNTWYHIQKTVFCTVSAIITSYLISKTKVHVPIFLYNKPSWAYPVYKILNLCKNNPDIKHVHWHNLFIIYSFCMLHTNNILQPNF